MKKELICIMCPVGCSLTVQKQKDEIIVSGNKCPRGKLYATEEMTCPKRIVTALAKTFDGKVVSVKTTNPIPKDKIFEVLNEIAKLNLKKYNFGQIVIKKVLGYDSDIVVTS